MRTTEFAKCTKVQQEMEVPAGELINYVRVLKSKVQSKNLQPPYLTQNVHMPHAFQIAVHSP